MGRTSPLQGYYLLSCGEHIGFASVKWLNQHPEIAFSCKFCEGILSTHENTVATALEEVFGTKGYINQARVVARHKAAVDHYVPEYNWIIQVDGEHHFDVDHHGNPALKQQNIDNTCDKLALAQGFNVLRIHFADTGKAVDTLYYCIGLPQEEHTRYLVHTAKYGNNDKEGKKVEKLFFASPVPSLGA